MIPLTRKPLDRRTVLRGALYGMGATLALPVLETMLNANGNAFADGTPLAKRFGIFFWGNGVRLSQWTPSKTGSGYDLKPNLAPFASLQSYVSVVSGTNVMTGNPRGHHAGCVGFLSGAPLVPQDPGNAGYCSTFSQPSIDQVVARAYQNDPAKKTAFRSLELGISKRVITGEGTTLNYLSHNGQDDPNKPIYSAHALFQRVFSPDFIASNQGHVDPKLALRRQLLDAVHADAQALQKKVSANDRKRLDQHLTSVAELQSRIAALEETSQNACTIPNDPPEYPERQGVEQLANLSTAMADVLALSLACDRTRVFSIMYSGSVGYTTFDDDGITQGSHDLSHNEGGDQPELSHGVTITMQHFKIFLDRLKNTMEGSSNLLEQSAILASSDLTQGHEHSIDDYPVLLVGHAGGALRGGVHYRSTTGENLSKVLITAMRAVDLPLTNGFGVDGGYVTDGIGALQV
jgi:hypothetical protein